MKIPKFEFGNQIEIAGMVLQGNGHNIALLFDKADENIPVMKKLSHEDWKSLLFQLDNLETEVLDPSNPMQKVIVRKSQRQVEQAVNWNVFKRDQYTCRYCGNDATPLTVDHIILWEDMGATIEDNLITACRKCNKTRGNMKYDDWLNSDYYKKVSAKLKCLTPGDLPVIYLNEQAGKLAKILPLRVTKRGR